MSALLNNTGGLLRTPWRVLIIPLLFALAFFLGAYFFFYRGGYNPPPAVPIPLEKIIAPSSSFTTSSRFTGIPPIQRGLLLMDTAHRNNFAKEEIVTLLSRVADRGYAVEFLGDFERVGSRERLELLEAGLRQADSFAVFLPGETYSQQEGDVVARFVQKGGKVLLLADPTRFHQINSLAERFGIAFQPDYLYNVVKYDQNFQDIFVSDFRPDELTRDLVQIVLYTAGSIKSSGPALAFTDGNTRSSITERGEPFYPLVRGSEGQVVAISDLTFMIPPQNSILSNDRLVSNIADYLTASARAFQLTDFPHFFQGRVDILLGRSSLFTVGTEVKSMLAEFQLASEIRGVEDLTRDAVYVGLYDDASNVTQYLDVVRVRVADILRTPFTSDIPLVGTGIILLHRGQERNALVILGDSPGTLADLVKRLGSGNFRDGLVADFVGVYRTR
jgi:hypothetical protein